LCDGPPEDLLDHPVSLVYMMCVLVIDLLLVVIYLSMDRIAFLDLPVDLLSPILSHLDDRRDWHSCCLVNQAFYSAAIPYLYRVLDSRVRIDVILFDSTSYPQR
jgi:hypothetical protein